MKVDVNDEHAAGRPFSAADAEDVKPETVLGTGNDIIETNQQDALVSVWKSIGQWGDWLNTDPPEREYLLSSVIGCKTSGVLPRGKTVMLAGAGCAGKSWLCIQLALAVATGKDWMGLKVTSPGKVLIILGEEDTDEAWRRLYYACQAMRLDDAERRLAYARIWMLPMAGRSVTLTTDSTTSGLPMTALVAELLTRLKDGAGNDGWRLIILDPLSRFAGPEVEKDNHAATSFVQVVEQFAAVAGRPTVLVTHHTTKETRKDGQSSASDAAAATAARGVSALTDGFRWQANIEPRKRIKDMPDQVIFKVVKNNYGSYPEDIYLIRDHDKHGALRLATPQEIEAQNKAESDNRQQSTGRDSTKSNGKNAKNASIPPAPWSTTC